MNELYEKPSKEKEEENGSFKEEVERLRRSIQKCYKNLVGGDQTGDLSTKDKLTKIEILMHEEIAKVKKMTKFASNEKLHSIHQFQRKLHNKRKDE